MDEGTCSHTSSSGGSDCLLERFMRIWLTFARASITSTASLRKWTSMLTMQTSKRDRQLSANCRSSPRQLFGLRTKERGFARGLTGKGCVEWETFLEGRGQSRMGCGEV